MVYSSHFFSFLAPLTIFLRVLLCKLNGGGARKRDYRLKTKDFTYEKGQNL